MFPGVSVAGAAQRGVIFSMWPFCKRKEGSGHYRAEDGYTPEDLLQFGIDHLEASWALGNGNWRHFDSAGYLAHLGLELLLKSWLLHQTQAFPKTHSLQKLRENVKKLVPSFTLTKPQNKLLDYLDGLEELRYPNRKNPTEMGQDNLKLVEELANEIWQRLPDNLVEKYEAIPENRKGGRVLMKRPAGLPIDRELLFSGRKTKT